MSQQSSVVVHGVVAVICRDGRFLSIRRPEGISLAGRWCFPGGAVEAAETQQAALVREVREEVGLDVEPREMLWKWTCPRDHLILYWWSTRLVDPVQHVQLNPREAAEYVWATAEQLRCLDGILENDLEFLDFVEATHPSIDSAKPHRETPAPREEASA